MRVIERIRAGDLDQRVTIQQVTEARDSFGGVTETWSDVATVWAGVKMLFGRELEAARHLAAETSHKITMRHRSGITTKMRVIWGSKTLDITAVDDTKKRKGELHLYAKEVI